MLGLEGGSHPQHQDTEEEVLTWFLVFLKLSKAGSGRKANFSAFTFTFSGPNDTEAESVSHSIID